MTGEEVPPRPLLSIITATYNRSRWLPVALASVGERRTEIEHLVIDAASTDGTSELLATHPHLRIVSEPDEGIYDAWNKGVSLARGEFLAFLNSDDSYRPEGLDAVIDELRDRVDARTEVVAAGFEIVDERGSIVAHERVSATLELTPRAIGLGTPAINARIFHRSVFDRVGQFDTDFRVAADTEFLLRCWASGVPTHFVDTILYRYVVHADSLTMAPGGVGDETLREVLRLIDANLSRPGLRRVDKRVFRRWRAGVLLSRLRVGLAARDPRAVAKVLRELTVPDIIWLPRAASERLIDRFRTARAS